MLEQPSKLSHVDAHIQRKQDKSEKKSYEKVRPYLEKLDKDVEYYKRNIQNYMKNISDDSVKKPFNDRFKDLENASKAQREKSRLGLGRPYSPLVAGPRETSQALYAKTADNLRKLQDELKERFGANEVSSVKDGDKILDKLPGAEYPQELDQKQETPL